MSIKDRIKIITRHKIEDKRGWFLKVINGKEDFLPNFTGEIYLTMAKPGEIKGGHFHNYANEWFTLIIGKCLLKLTDINTLEKHLIILNSDNPETIFIPHGIAHSFENNSNAEFILLAYTDQLFNPGDTIAFHE